MTKKSISKERNWIQIAEEDTYNYKKLRIIKSDHEPVCEYEDVDDVEDDADNAYGEGEVAMHWLIQLLHT